MSSLLTKYHHNLANYFNTQTLFLDGDKQKQPNIRKCMELPWQQTKAELWDDVTNSLCNLDFIQAKACAKQTYDLVEDFNRVLEVLPENQENIEKERKRQERLDKYTRDLIAYSKSEIDVLEVPESITPWTEEQIDAEIERIKLKPTILDRLSDFQKFINNESFNLQDYALSYPHFSIQQAWNFAKDGFVGLVATQRISEKRYNILLQSQELRKPWNPIGIIQMIINIDNLKMDPKSNLFVNSNGRIAVTSNKNLIKIWDLDSGKLIKSLSGHDADVDSFDCSADGSIIFSVAGYVDGKKDIKLIVHSTFSGIQKIIRSKSSSYGPVNLTADGNKGFSRYSKSDGYCEIVPWNLASGQELTHVAGYNNLSNFSITPNGRFAIASEYWSEVMFYWDLLKNTRLSILKGHRNKIICLKISIDGKYAASASLDDETLIIWNLKDGTILKRQNLKVWSIDFSADSRYIIAGCHKKIVLWDWQKTNTPYIIPTYNCNAYSVTLSPDCKYAYSIMSDGKLIVWNLYFLFNIKNMEVKRVVHEIDIFKNHVAAVSFDNKTEFLDLKSISSLGEIFHDKKDIAINTHIILDFNYCITIADDKTMGFLNLSTGKWEYEYDNQAEQYSICISPDRKHAVTYGWSYTVWCLESKKPIFAIEGHRSEEPGVIVDRTITGLKFCPQGKYLLTGSRDKNLVLWNLENGEIVFKFIGHTWYITSLDISPDGSLAASASADTTIIIWDIKKGKQIKLLKNHTGQVESVRFSPDGKKMVSVSNGEVYLWNLRSHYSTTFLKIERPNKFNNSAIFLDADRHIIVFSKEIIIWDSLKNKSIARFTSNSANWQGKFYHNGIISGGYSGEVFVINNFLNWLTLTDTPVTIISKYNLKSGRYLKESCECPFCCKEITPSMEILNRINEVYPINIDESPCLSLPDNAWMDSQLLFKCEGCGAKLRYNPFIVGEYEYCNNGNIYVSDLDGHNYEYYFKRGLKYLNNKNYNKALIDFKRALELNPSFQLAFRNLANTYFEKKEYQQAIHNYNKALILDSKDDKSLFGRGETFYKLNEFKSAVDDYTKAISLNPANALYYFNRAFAYDDLKDYKSSIQDYNKVIELSPNSVSAYNNRGSAFENSINLKSALEDFQKTIQLNSKYHLGYRNLGRIYVRLKEFNKSIEVLTIALQLKSDDAMAFLWRGNAYLEIAKYQEAIQDFTFAVKMRPNNAMAYYNRGICFRISGDTAMAIEDFRRAHNLGHKYALAELNKLE